MKAKRAAYGPEWVLWRAGPLAQLKPADVRSSGVLDGLLGTTHEGSDDTGGRVPTAYQSTRRVTYMMAARIAKRPTDPMRSA